jgi:putative restriction endonuclease
LQNDGVWHVATSGTPAPRKSNSDPPRGELIANDARGAFSAEVQAALRADPSLASKVAARLLEGHFPASLHEEVLDAVGLDLAGTVGVGKTATKRDPQFRQRVLTAYEWKCAVCGFNVRLGSVPIALDAAHVRWHQAGGPPEPCNGLALCVLHHKVFDLGAFTVTPGGCCSSPTRPTARRASRRH